MLLRCYETYFDGDITTLKMQHEDATEFVIKHLSIEVYYKGGENHAMKKLQSYNTNSNDVSDSVIPPLFLLTNISLKYNVFSYIRKIDQKDMGQVHLAQDLMDKIPIV